MPRTKHGLGAELDVAYLISVGTLSRACPRPLIEDTLRRSGKGGHRQRLLPAAVLVYFVMAMALWREAALEEVLRVICEGLNWLGGIRGKVACAGKAAISQARSRLGWEVMSLLADQVLRPIALPGSAGCWYGGRRVMAVDGSCFDLADEKLNAEHFGYPSASRGESAFPQMRVLSLVECGTHVVTAAEMGPYHRSEQDMAGSMFPRKLTRDMLLLADRGFYSFKLWRLAQANGAALLWRVQSSLKLPVEQKLSDGSYLSRVYDSKDRGRRNGAQVRVIEYTLSGPGADGVTTYRLISSLLDPQTAPAVELAALYHERWEIENVFGEIKTRLYGYRTILRSKTPDLVRQEMWGLLMAHFAIRQLMYEAAASHDLNPDSLSFIKSVQIIKRKLPQAAALSPRATKNVAK
jgi:hypothetical protein